MNKAKELNIKKAKELEPIERPSDYVWTDSEMDLILSFNDILEEAFQRIIAGVQEDFPYDYHARDSALDAVKAFYGDIVDHIEFMDMRFEKYEK